MWCQVYWSQWEKHGETHSNTARVRRMTSGEGEQVNNWFLFSADNVPKSVIKILSEVCFFFLFFGGISSSEVVEMCVFLIAAPIDFKTAQTSGTKARFSDKITFTPFLGSLTVPSLKFKGFCEVSCVFLCLSLLSLPLLNFYGQIVKRFSTIKVADFDGSWFEDSAKGKQARYKGWTSPGKMQKYLLMYGLLTFNHILNMMT